MSDERKRRARSDAIAAFSQAWIEATSYVEHHASPDERAALVGFLPDLQELGRRFEWATNPERDR